MSARAWIAAAVLAVGGCGADGRGTPEIDVTPPTLIAVVALDSCSVEIRFSEASTLVAGTFACDPPLELTASRSRDGAIVLETSQQVPGTRYLLELTAEDARGNTAHVLAVLYGFNPAVPAVRINELTVRGSATHPDIVELRVESEGDMGGLALLNGTAGSWTSRVVFPSFRVGPGDFLLAHFKPEGLSVEIDEAGDKSLSGGLDSSAAAYDFWVPEGTGLNGNNGVVSLYSRIGGPVLDAILYSNRTSASDVEYRGFGTAETMERAVEIAETGGWLCEGEAVRPEDAVDPEPVDEHALDLPPARRRHRHARRLVHRAHPAEPPLARRTSRRSTLLERPRRRLPRSLYVVLDELLDGALRDGADRLVDGLPLVEDDKGRDALDLIPDRELLLLVDVDLDDLELAVVGLSDLLDHGLHHPAGHAPDRPEVGEHGLS